MSAFAKRRRLNDGSTSASIDSDGSSSAKSAKMPRKKGDVKSFQSITPPEITLSVENKSYETPNTAGPGPSGNSFTALVDASVVKFSGTREIEQIDSRSYKVRLSKGQVRSRAKGLCVRI